MKQIISTKIAANGMILALLLLAFALRLHKVASVPLGFDEIRTISRYVDLSIIEILGTHHTNNHPLASVLAHLFSPQADHLFLMRWPMILVGMFSLPFVYRLSTDLFNQRVGLLALLLVSLAPVHIGYSVIVRGYIGLVSLTIISLYLLGRALRCNRWREWIGFVVVNVLVIHFHLFGVLAAGMQLGLVGLWLLWVFIKEGRRQSLGFKWRIEPRLIKFGLVTLLLAAIYAPLIYIRTSSAFSEARYLGDFAVWYDGVFFFTEDISPLTEFVRMMALMSPGDIGAIIYLAFFAIGLVYLWQYQRVLGIAAFIWFVGPFVAIFVLKQSLGFVFFAYVRFLLFLLPTFLILVAVGMEASVGWLLILTEEYNWRWWVMVRVAIGGFVVGLLILFTISTNWYVLTSTHTDWQGIAKFLSQELQSRDITICEENHGFDVPDRAKAYCTWMLDFYMPELQGDTSHFQTSVDYIADYDHLQEQRATMAGPGNIWLVLWQKIPFHPGQLVTDKRPSIMPPPSLSIFEPYQAWHFGTATLVHIDSEKTLFGNIYKMVELLSQIEQSPANKARYYRSLAKMEAIQGYKQKASQYLEESREMVEFAGGMYPESFLGETQQVIDQIPDYHSPPETASEIGYKFGQSLCLRAYEVFPARPEADRSLWLTLYWQTLDFIEEDYDFYLRLDDESGQAYARLVFEPFDRVYPTPWWWADQQLVERREFYIPADLFGQDYLVQLGAYDRQLPGREVITPLFLMLYQSDGVEPVHWDIEPTARPTSDCP